MIVAIWLMLQAAIIYINDPHNFFETGAGKRYLQHFF